MSVCGQYVPRCSISIPSGNKLNSPLQAKKEGALRLELKRKTTPPAHWFMPPSQTQQI